MKLLKIDNKGWGTLEMVLLSCGLLLALFISVILISMLYSSQEKNSRMIAYRNFENNLSVAAEEYVLQKEIVVTDSLRINYSTLRSEGYMKNINPIIDDDCDGYVIVTTNGLVNHYKSYITCKDYKTEN